MKSFLAGLGVACGVVILAGAVQQQDSEDAVAQALDRIAAAQERQAAAWERAVDHGAVTVPEALGISLPEPSKDDRRATVAETKSGIVQIASALDQYAVANNGRYPASLKSLVIPDENGATFLGRRTLPKDPWGNEYAYEPPSAATHEYRIVSYGSDGVPGGEGEARDIDNIMIRKGEV